MPNKICSRCLLLLRAAYKFRDLCEQSQQQLKQFINPPKVEQEEDDDNLLSTKEQDEDDCVVLSASAQEDLVEYNDDKMVSAMEREIEHQMEEEETNDHYVYEQINEVSQDAEQFIGDDSNSYSLDDNSIQFEYYDATTDSLKEPKYNPPTMSNDIIEEELSQPVRRVTKRKRTRISNGEIKAEDGGGGIGIYRCGFCPNVYHDKAKYMLHIKIHRKVKPHECE